VEDKRYPLDSLVQHLGCDQASRLLHSEEAADVVNKLWVQVRSQQSLAGRLATAMCVVVEALTPQERCALQLNDNLSPSWKHMYYAAHLCQHTALLTTLLQTMAYGVTYQFASTMRGNLHVQQLVEDLTNYILPLPNVAQGNNQEAAMYSLALNHFLNTVSAYLQSPPQRSTPEHRCLQSKFRRLQARPMNQRVAH